MEEIEDVQNEKKEVNVELIYYLDEEEAKKGFLKFTYDKEIEFIYYNDIMDKFNSFIKEKQKQKKEKDIFLIIKSIRYFNGDGWIILRENEVIFIDEDLTLNNLKIMIFCDIIGQNEMKIKKDYDEIDKKISEIYIQLNKEKNYDSTQDTRLNLVVLTANPLMHDDAELRTMNDFNIITSRIYEAFKEKNFLKSIEFKPLTLEILKNVISDEKKVPKILHLICKSTYIIPEQGNNNISSNNSEDYTNLIFEDDNNYYNLEFINKKKLEDEIFKYELNSNLKENVEKIILIVSTPLATDVFNIFKKFGFKNILIQHTTLADVNFVADFNYTFYKDIITYPEPLINNIYEDALNIGNDNNTPTFCCCFHKHKTTCYFFKNIINELYNSNEINNIENLKESIPHFYHLFPDCFYTTPTCNKIVEEYKKISNVKKFPEINFCCHLNDCFKEYKYMPKINKNNKKIINIIKEEKGNKKKEKVIFINICCCETNSDIHNIKNVFIKDFSFEEKNNEIRFKDGEIMGEKQEYIPNYEKMISFIGNNKVIFKVLKYFLSKKYFSLNIYGDNINNLEKFGDVIIEYYLERYYFF